MPLLIITTLLGVSFFTTSILSTLLLAKSRVSSRIFLSLASYGAAIWILAMLIFVNITNPLIIIIAAKTLYVAGAIIITNFIYFAYSFFGLDLEKNKKLIFGAGIPLILSAIFIIFTKTVISGVKLLDSEKIVMFGPFYYFYSAYIILGAFLGYYYLYKKARINKDDLVKRQLTYIGFGTILPISSGLFFDIILPFFGHFAFYWLGPVLTTFFVIFTSYAIFKHHLFEIRIIATELFSSAICIVLLIKFLSSGGLYDYLINGGMLAVAGVFGLLLVRSVIHEVEQKNKIEAMAGDVKKAYDIEKKAKEELQRIDEAKSQFMMATQHHLRTPLTALKGYLSMTMEGDFGPISDIVKEKLGSCFESTNRLIKLVNEFLDISKLQLGRDILDIKETSIVEMLKDIIVEVKPEADKKGIYLILALPPEPASLIMADAVKLREALYNLIDNAVKYTEKGGVKVDLRFVVKGKKNYAEIVVTDTGIGMTKQEADDVFGRQFERGKEAKKVYALGRGIGLFITASIIKAHKGKIWAESSGQGQGSLFYVELVAKQ